MPPDETAITASQILDRESQKVIREELARESVSAVRLIEHVIQHAHALQSSDIHLDPGETILASRFRVDGKLRDAHDIPMWIHREILARLKILAGLRIDEHGIPQDGRFRFFLTERVHPDSVGSSSLAAFLDIRLSIAPTYYGENAVLRLLSSRDQLNTFESLGLSSIHQTIIRRALSNPHGLLLLTGPTGSGKTSTLYAFMQYLNTRLLSIITIEDPIEYSMEGINQIQASQRSGLTFAEGLRSILRQDPNIIGIGEIRDHETASLAVHAALTGHLVLSTLHTTSAPSALPRLIDLGIEPYLIASTIQLVVAERLVRRLCTFCRVSKALTEEQRLVLTNRSGNLEISSCSYFSSIGCLRCENTGSNGRIGIFEILFVNNELRDAIARKASARELSLLAQQDGMQTLFEDGMQKAAEGLVPIDEVLTLIHE
ncbi:type II/IV secretion system protein [Patescibacteria group bacterium]|nr:type II/IV secretion system protein [Patescibacteria group bacterium]